MSSIQRLPVIIDTDPGVDDTLALAHACGDPTLNIVAFSSSLGNSGINTTHRNLLFAAQAFFATPPPILRGVPNPSSGSLTHSVVHGNEGLGNIIPDQRPEDPNVVYPASPDGIVALLKEAEEPITIIELAPLTNIAAAIELDKEAFQKCKDLIILGGAFRAPGNVSAVAEFNFKTDPEAANIVLSSRACPMTIIPLDVCFEAVLQLKDLTQVENGDFREFLNQLCIPYSEGNQKEEGIPGIIMYDPLAIFCASYPDAFDYEELYVQVDCGNGIARGMSIADRRLSCTEKPNTRVATKMNFDRFKDHFFNSLNNVTFNPSWSYTI